jgi:hypothetical protein
VPKCSGFITSDFRFRTLTCESAVSAKVLWLHVWRETALPNRVFASFRARLLEERLRLMPAEERKNWDSERPAKAAGRSSRFKPKASAQRLHQRNGLDFLWGAMAEGV